MSELVKKATKLAIDPLHGDFTFGHFCIHPFSRRLVGGQKCIAVIERKALIVSLFTNASDYSNETTICDWICEKGPYPAFYQN